MSGISDLGGLSTNSSQWHVPVVSQDEAATSLTPPSRRHRLPQMHRPARQALVPDEPEALETPPSMVAAEIGREIVRLVPHWYSAECGPNQYGIPIGAHSAQFYNHCELTPSQSALLEKISEKTRELPLEYFTQMPGLIDVLLESIAIEWLRIHSNAVDWTKIIKYLEALARRTYENVPVALNLIIRPGRGTQDITEPRFQKFLDRLASSPLTYFAVDSELRLIEFGEVDWAQLRRVPSYKFHPDALHPIYGIMGDDDLSAHLTPQGDIIVMNKSGLLAARHKRRWKLYEIETLKDSFTRWLKSDCVGANLFEVVLDLSMRRMGALFVYDPEHRIRERILNPESIIFSGWKADANAESCSGQSLIGPSIENIAIGEGLGSLKSKRRLIELACVDGAVVFDDNHLLAVGALIRSHPSVGNQLGARTTAGRSAYLWGAHPIKVSSDGDATLYFQSASGPDQCDAVMHFL
ncbi:MAG: hypothetical protein ACLQNE_42650 [Thermoguttaceae bacterium]